jgi:type I restriction enzyme S subunit
MCKLGDISILTAGYAFKSKDFCNVGEKVIKITDIQPPSVNITNASSINLTPYDIRKLSKYLVTKDDFVIAMTGATIGKVGYVHEVEKAYINQRVCKLDAQHNADKRFIYYLVTSRRFEEFIKANIDSESAQANISTTSICRFPVNLPTLPEQKTIADILGSLDDKIELNRKMNETLEEMARALFKSWFVDFDPVVAKSQGRQPEGMDAETAKLFTDSFVDSEIGRIPKGWNIRNIGDCVTVVGGATPSTSNPIFWNGSHCFCTPKDLSGLSSPLLLETERKITDEGLKQIGSGLLNVGTVLLSSRAPIGYLAITNVPTAINQGFIAMICDKELNNQYVLRWAEANMDLIKGRANGTTFMEVSKSAFRPIRVVVPTLNILSVFSKMVEALHLRMVGNLNEINTLCQVRDSLLPRLLSGTISPLSGTNIHCKNKGSLSKSSFNPTSN